MRSIFFLSALLVTQAAYAQSDPMAEAEAAFNEAEAYYNLGDWQKALEYYKKSFLLSKSPALLFNLGQCQRQMGLYEDAQRSYKNFLRQTNLPADDPYRVQAEKLLVEVEAKLASAKTQPAQPENKPTVTQPEPTSNPIIEEPNKTKSPIATAAPLWGASGAALLVGAIGGLTARGDLDQLSRLHNDENVSPEQFDDIAKSARRKALLCDLALLTAAGTAVGGFLVFQKANKKAETSVQLTPTGASMMVRF
jgi:tetratricopeptide (TPR) repeat protein